MVTKKTIKDIRICKEQSKIDGVDNSTYCIEYCTVRKLCLRLK